MRDRHYGSSYAMRKTLRKYGCECQTQEEDKGYCSHGAKVAKAIGKRNGFLLFAQPLASSFMYCQEFLPRCEIIISTSKDLERLRICLLGVGPFPPGRMSNCISHFNSWWKPIKLTLFSFKKSGQFPVTTPWLAAIYAEI